MKHSLFYQPTTSMHGFWKKRRIRTYHQAPSSAKLLRLAKKSNLINHFFSCYQKDRLISMLLTAYIKQTVISFLLQPHKIRAKIYTLPSIYPKGLCFAQIPLPQEPIEDTMLTLYVSGGNKKPILWPDFRQLPVSDVTNFLRTHAIEASVIHEHACLPNHTCASCIVTDQRPLAGSLISLDPQKPCAVQLQVQQRF